MSKTIIVRKQNAKGEWITGRASRAGLAQMLRFGWELLPTKNQVNPDVKSEIQQTINKTVDHLPAVQDEKIQKACENNDEQHVCCGNSCGEKAETLQLPEDFDFMQLREMKAFAIENGLFKKEETDKWQRKTTAIEKIKSKI
jgi:hypothetical protein